MVELCNQEVPGSIPSCWIHDSGLPEKADGQPSGWQSYWETLCDEHQLFREQAGEYVRNLQAVLAIEADARVLDFGCGFGLVATMLAPKVKEVALWDASPNMRRRTRKNVVGQQNVRFVDLSEPMALPHDVRFDVILVNSVVQYMTLDEFSAWLVRWHAMLAHGGRIVVSDLIPPDYRSTLDITDLLRFSARRGFLKSALAYALGELAGYWRTRRARPLTRVSCEELNSRGQIAGLKVTYLPINLTHFSKRVTAVFTAADN